MFKAHTSSVRTVQFSRDAETLLTSSDDKVIDYLKVRQLNYGPLTEQNFNTHWLVT